MGAAPLLYKGLSMPTMARTGPEKRVYDQEEYGYHLCELNDIFRTRRYYAFSESLGFTQTDWRRRDPQIVEVNFSHRFGKFDIGLFKRKNMKGESEGMQNGMQGMGQ